MIGGIYDARDSRKYDNSVFDAVGYVGGYIMKATRYTCWLNPDGADSDE